MKLWLLLTFLDSATPIMEGIVDLHNEIMFFLVVILGFVTYILGAIVYHFVYGVYSPSYLLSKKEKGVDYFKMLVDFNKFSHYSTLEIVWTLIPSFILILIVVPSFILLYSMDEVIDPALTLKVIGHQWYWSYEYSTELHENGRNEGLEKSFDSYLVDEADLKLGQLRLLEVDNRVVLPVLTHVRVLVTADDVLHSWAVPALGVKIDAVPGRLNQTFIYMKREGVFYGQCSELCGVNHGFMPIVVQGVDLNTFIEWLRSE